MIKSVTALIGVGILAVIIILTLLAAITALEALIVMLLWNFVVPDVFNGPEIGFLQAWALLFILNIIGSYFRSHLR